jgi:hypothetical protein
VAAWGTKASGHEQVFEAFGIFPNILIDGKAWKEESGIHDLSSKSLEIKYPLGEKGQKTIRFEDDKIVVEVNYPGGFTEILPLMTGSGDHLKIDNNRVQLHSPSNNMQLQLQNANEIEQKTFNEDLGIKSCNVLEVKAKDHLSYTISF